MVKSSFDKVTKDVVDYIDQLETLISLRRPRSKLKINYNFVIQLCHLYSSITTF